MMTGFTRSLRLATAGAIVLALVVPGWLGRSPWVVVLATPAFTLLYALGKWSAWKGAWRAGGARAILLSVLVTIPVQFVLAGVFYLVGLGAGKAAGAAGPPRPLAPGDVAGFAVLLIVTLALAITINTMEARAGRAVDSGAAGGHAGGGGGSARRPPSDVDVELDIDPAPLTPETFYRSRGYWKTDALWEALEQRGGSVVKPPEAASEAAILAAEARLGVRLPERLRDLYEIMDGGYVGPLYVPLAKDPRPVYDDWRGAFSIDYSSLYSLDGLKTLAERYEESSYEPEDVPEDPGKIVVLQSRYLDMTVLDYRKGPEPTVRIVDFDPYADRSEDAAFDDFDSFFAALRRPRQDPPFTGSRLALFRSEPLGEMPPGERPALFWGQHRAHAFRNAAASRKEGWAPRERADDALVAETERRIGFPLPRALTELWRELNGGSLWACYLDVTTPGREYEEIEIATMMPMEHFATLAEVSARIVFPEGERPLADRYPGADRLVLLHGRGREAVMLDYRGKGAEPAVLILPDVEDPGQAATRRVDSFELLVHRLRRRKTLG